ncbi:uncharacterized protein LOC128155607 [Crassostrea angulata]|nr:uncharacterized protein LOC105324595 [Crassostrea gigas]XP_052673366.1 uncharacterized protein LOC128155607 [Crassostrea angulata]XP_052673368.1 uncharacterized protein LOC128155607 [Crassostrea angulata]
MQLVIFSCLVVFAIGQHHHLNNHELQQLVDPGFQSLDINPKDGLLEHDELSKLFDMRDTDGNGNLSREEFGAHTGLDFLFKDPLFDHFDTDHDGVLSKDEFVEKPFAEMNQNGDSEVSRHEFDHFYTQLLHHINQHHG